MRKVIFILFFFLLNTGIIFAQSYPDYLSAHRTEYIQSLKEEFPNSVPDFYEFNEDFFIEAYYKKRFFGKTISVPTSSGKIKKYKEYALLKFEMEGKPYILTVYRQKPINPEYKDYLFLPLRDLTAPEETYGGGRYLDLKIQDFSKKTVLIDFNKLYNPYCVFSDGWNCPIPPKNNHISLRIEAGEKNPIKTEFDL